ncbi:single-stranded-DNA-specific exonuclease RecJ [Murimonas intestini]|uniref:Single-stranded-DNA-specific exonuclease RecJ n=1 Tax=Murimonas intestini TaxID=1337051 RepID=A0AB73T9Q4_9FIRM|nr:single-stranded-DNA-specific exonuclease RecJ [Murimonas intestini]MCR1839160.1 single-stranded-DNA-specific exonuclease RecJ [Murimonas intestini]MCR1864456.1 single-stranded-DNA-specific exonuclease RecJ [Murimonas intestini]MCR1882066.1 single-stranded-DNA-specific exonuclease RecJ [Murimonas intestini]
MEKWVVSAKRADFAAIAERFHIDQVTARIIRNRDVVTEEEIEEYLTGTLESLASPHLLMDCDKAAGILAEKIREQKAVRVIGDYDIDGVCSTYILLSGLKRCGANVDIEIPDRIRDGYGINEQLIQQAYEDGTDTILTCDNGIAAIEQVAYAKKLGMCVIVTDHHELHFDEKEGEKVLKMPEADAVVNPKRPDCAYPFKGLCGAAVAYKLIRCLYGAMGLPEEEADAFVEYAAIATVGDVMDLKGENRILVKEGLKMLRRTGNAGLRALIHENGLEDAHIGAYHIGFVLGPCINASGRLDTAKKALALLAEEDGEKAALLAAELRQLNDERKQMTSEGLEEAIKIIEEGALKLDKVLVVYLPSCHESLAGIIAGRIRERYNKPVFVLTDSEGKVKGSGRSIEAYNMFEGMMSVQELFVKFGGHPMAGGLTLEKENVELFRKKINMQAALTDEDFIPKITIDVPMPIHYITEKLIGELELLEPFGKGNTKPVFAEKGLTVTGARILGKNRNVLKFQVLNQSGTVMDAMYFGDVNKMLDYLSEKFGPGEVQKMLQQRENNISMSVTYYPSVNEFRDKRSIQIVIQNYQ